MGAAGSLSSALSRSTSSSSRRHHALLSLLVVAATTFVHVQAYPSPPRSFIRRTTTTASAASTSSVSASASIEEFPTRTCNVLICGGGPVGLAAALSLARRGYTDIHVVERNPSASYSEVDKSYLYRIDGRGQRLTNQLGITERMEEVSTKTSEFLNYTVVLPDGTVEVKSAVVDPNQQTAYWLPRRALLSFLASRIEEEARGAITFHFGASVERLVMPATREGMRAPGAEARVRLRFLNGTNADFASRRVLGCDGMNSKIRTGLAEWAAGEAAAAGEKDANRFGMRCVDSTSAGLRYKILTMLDDFPITLATSSTNNVTKREISYSYVSKSKPGPGGGFRLGLLPLKMKGIPRTANIIAKSSAPIFSLSTGPEVLDYLRAEFPQCDIDRMVSAEEADRFARSRGGSFPRPSYCLETQAVLGGDEGRTMGVDEKRGGIGGGVLLLGDAIHVFPPDLGAGVNSAFLDVVDLMNSLDRSGDDWGRALPLYEELRAPQSRAICELIPIGFPQQYNQIPVRKSIKLLGVGLRLALSKVLPWLFSPPVFLMCQDARLDFSHVWEKQKKTARIMNGLSLVIIGAVLQKLAIIPRIITLKSRYMP